MINNIEYKLSQEDAKDILDYLKDVEEMYLTTEVSISQNIRVLREKLQKQYKEQTTGA